MTTNNCVNSMKQQWNSTASFWCLKSLSQVIGKAMVLDETINYIQSLQRQVEFLSMKLEAVNARMNLGMEGYPPKDHHFGPQPYDTPGVAYSTQPPREYSRGSSPYWLHTQVGGGCFQRQA